MKKSFVVIGANQNDINNIRKYLMTLSYIELIWEEDKPEYVFVMTGIYGGVGLSKLKKYYKNERCIFIFFADELAYPDLNLFDYGITWDLNNKCSDRLFSVMFLNKIRDTDNWRNEITYEKAKSEASKRRFCNFIYSNSNAHPMRDTLFYEISKYKTVDSLGRHLKNINVRTSRRDLDWEQKAIKMKSKYKFSIAAENALSSGYTSEKLIHSLEAHTIPIYFGNPEVGKMFNSEAILNVHDYNSIDELLERVKEIDKNDSLWEEYVTKPWITEKQRERYVQSKKDFDKWLKHIFEQDIRDAIRRPIGTYPDGIVEQFCSPNWKQVTNRSHIVLKDIVKQGLKLMDK